MKNFKSILILTALEQEESALLKLLKSQGHLTTVNLNTALNLSANVAIIGNKKISVLRCGIGSVNSALALLVAWEALSVDAVILLGVGGALKSDLNIGDLVVSTCVLQHDYVYTFDHADVRIRPGALVLSSQDAVDHTPHMDASGDLIDVFKGITLTDHSLRFGAIVSGGEFAGRLERKLALGLLHPDALLVEMEGAGIAQLALKLNLPFVVAKTVSDRLNPDGSIENDFKSCLEAACDHAARVLYSLL